MREEMKKAYEDVVGEPWDDAGLHKQAWCISRERAWQASRECLVIKLPNRPFASEAHQEQMSDYEIGEGHGGIAEWDKCREAIHAAGVKTK